MAENIKLNVTNQPNFAVYQGYFYTFDYVQDSLLQKTDDGTTAFSYPFDTLLSVAVDNAEYDGVYFWSLEDPDITGTLKNMTIRRWKIDNYVCKLQQTISLVADVSHDYHSRAFAVEHYHDTLSAGISVGGTGVNLTTYSGSSSLNFTTTSGAKLTIHLGPNTNGEEEDVIVSTVSSGVVTTASGTTYGYTQGDPAHFYTYIWMFNNFDGKLSTTGALYKLDAYTGALVTKYPSGAYMDITASTFYKVDSFTDYGDVDTLCFIKGTNTLFINTSSSGVTLPYYGSMVMRNILSDTTTIIPVKDLAMDSQNVYRLQRAPDAGSSVTQWSYYSYVLSTLDPFVTSISLAAYPATIAANTVSTAGITAMVKDQFLLPIAGRLVAFTDDDTPGYIVTTPVNTDSDGKAMTTYRSGNTAREVKITAVVEQT
jgi:hypothetical protein